MVLDIGRQNWFFYYLCGGTYPASVSTSIFPLFFVLKDLKLTQPPPDCGDCGLNHWISGLGLFVKKLIKAIIVVPKWA